MQVNPTLTSGFCSWSDLCLRTKFAWSKQDVFELSAQTEQVPKMLNGGFECLPLKLFLFYFFWMRQRNPAALVFFLDLKTVATLPLPTLPLNTLICSVEVEGFCPAGCTGCVRLCWWKKGNLWMGTDDQKWLKSLFFSYEVSSLTCLFVERIMKNGDGAESSVKMLDKSIQAVGMQMQTCSACRGEKKRRRKQYVPPWWPTIESHKIITLRKIIVVFASTCLQFLCGRKWKVEQNVIIM